jgi:hypothetical protein
VEEILRHCFAVVPYLPAAIVMDRHCELTQELAAAYQRLLPQAQVFDVEDEDPETLKKNLFALPAGSLVVLAQSSRFELSKFRLRLQLFQRGLRVAEHPHLQRVRPDELVFFAESLGYDPSYYGRVGSGLKRHLDGARYLKVTGEGWSLNVASSLEDAKTNLGFFAPWTDWGLPPAARLGGQFPIGEVFTEACDIEAVSGEAKVFAYANENFEVVALENPAILIIEKGRVTDTQNTPVGFLRVLDAIRANEGVVWVRELGFGLNRAFTPEKRVQDIGAYERMCGVHLSLGAKHSIYSKPGFPNEGGGYHVDVFLAAESVVVDETEVFQKGTWQIHD